MKRIKFILSFFMTHFTLAKLLGGLFTALFMTTLKYYISGGFQIEYSEFWINLGIAMGGWTLNTGVIGLLTDYLNTKDININLKQLIFGFYTMNTGPEPGVEEFKPKLYNAMDSSDKYNLNKGLDKNKGVESQRNYGESSVFFPSATNPGPGFNVPGGEVPIRDEICKNIDYNSHILSQFKNMDLETALEQRNNNIMFIKVLENKMDFAQKAFSKLPAIPTTEYEFKLKNKILRDLDSLSKDKIRAESRATLLSSRIDYIGDKINKK